jgi:transmembrane sensor
MSARATGRDIDDRAALWAAKVDGGALSPADQSTLDAWLAEDTRHLGAFAKARAIALHTERARALGQGFDPARFADAMARDNARELSRRRVIVIGSIAASTLMVAVTSGFVWHAFAELTYSTRIGETRVVPLEDGSVVTLNTDTEIAVNYSEKRRDIRLVRGEALFDVAHDARRPFVVDADGTLVRAVGTSFTVQLLPDEPVQVLVREGVVEVKRPKVPEAPPVRVAANMRAVAPDSAPIAAKVVPVAEVTRALAWRVGRIAFEGKTLKQAAEEFSRYSDTKIVIEDSTVANETITGLFVSNDPVAFSKAVALSLGVHAQVGANEVRITR